ncbi:MAG: CPBP family intramembrane metalloprotease [Clostridia bacterium]|nr:CPBP family intramembrane metalloprotease [Clostridia bacterium]
MLKKLYHKSPLAFAILWIVAYCVLMSVGDGLSEMLGVEKLITLIIGLLLSAVLLLFLKKNRLTVALGLCRPKASFRSMLFYVPVLLMFASNLWPGLAIPMSTTEAVFSVLSMLCVGFLEEIIFRGLLFEAMRKDSLTAAVIVSSVTFGIGHIINLINGSGAELLPNLLQVVYATAAGFMFVMIYLKSQSLVFCIVAHGIFNGLGVFTEYASASAAVQIVPALYLTVVTGGYALYLALSMKRSNRGE